VSKILDKAGTFRAVAIEQAIPDPEAGKLACAVIRFSFFQEAVNGEWQDMPEQKELTGWFYLEKKDGSVNEITMEQLNGALGCPKHDPYWLESQDLSEKPVQIVTDFETYNNKTRLKVKFLNPDGYTGSSGQVQKSSDNGRKAVQARLGAKLRALYGAPVAAPRPKPAQVQKQKPPAAPPPAEEDGESSFEEEPTF
jgi:hypothetical protein